MTVQTGQLVPAFSGTSFKGEPIDLEAYRGRKVWVGFYRWASCPLCNLRMKELLAIHDRFAAQGIQHIAVFQSPPETIATYVGAQDPPFPLIADPDLVLYDRFGVRPSWRAMFYPRVIWRAIQATFAGLLSLKIDGPKAMVPADFLIDPEGLVYQAYYGEAISDHIPFEDVDAFAADDCLDMPDDVGGT